jgi:phosphatidylserine decarboxylase
MSVVSLGERLRAALLYPLPHHAISRLIHALARLRTPLRAPLVRWFVRRYGLDMGEALEPDPLAYPHFNALFTRALHPEARPVAEDPLALVSPADARISQIGPIEAGRIVQAKGRTYSLRELLGGSKTRAAPFRDGLFATLYLSPRDYHRVHMPAEGVLREMVHVPGRLFSVAPFTTRAIPRLFARNERVACVFEGEFGPFAVVMVGAINVGAIETVWAGPVTPPRGRRIETRAYAGPGAPHLRRAQEMGRFNLGSTVILLLPPEAACWAEGLAEGQALRVGQAMGHWQGLRPDPS